ncbi:YncE family protein [Arachidicoccus ginsenosidivorans]|jgi:DNA-binding beta-propeller fold protein YncE|uniref:YncE family protein n=1 Tax=Arachidicoccus ginsenosidivorans TaxID=496057 RepID=A0A5B8VQ65_9BACT|nr:DUF5074 domain-containing protein [Arachidicoccus ginsenosidivorans]QEC72836.1 YncE family protein [Arachidicoccus ginsenosidivorans]
MKRVIKNSPLFLSLCILVLFAGCRKELGVIPPETTQVMAPGSYGGGLDFYLLNEGNMGSNHASLDYFNHQAGTYALNIYERINPDVTLGLGDVGNDLKIYGGKLYIAVNGSGKVEVLDKYTGVKLCQILVDNCRKLAFWKSKVLITSYKGFVGVVDTSRLLNGAGSVSLDNQIPVGREPEGLAVSGDKVYVANSGGYSPPIYDKTLSVIDLLTEHVQKSIVLGVNLNDVQKDDFGHIIVSARGNYKDISPSFYVIDSATDKLIKQVAIPLGNFTIQGNLMYYFTSPYNQDGTLSGQVNYGRFNLKTLSGVQGSFLAEDVMNLIKIPFALAVDPVDNKILISDAGDNTTPGTLYWIGNNGEVLWKVRTGEIPGHIAFLE